MPLYLTETDVAELLTPADAVEAIEACFERMAAGSVENRPRYRLGLEEGALAVMAAADLELGYAGAKVYAGFRDGARFAVLLFRADSPELVAVLEADKLGQLRTGAASGVAAKHLAASGASSLGVIGCGWQAESQVACIRAALPQTRARRCLLPDRGTAARLLRGARRRAGREPPGPGRVRRRRHGDHVARSRSCAASGCVPARSSARSARTTAAAASSTTSSSSAPRSSAATRVDDAKLESADLIEPVESGVLDWLEVHELQEVVGGEVTGRQSDEDIVVFKSNGLAAWDVAVAAAAVERARVAGAGREVS